MARKSKTPRVLPTRSALPGQSGDHELALRARIAEQFQPTDAFEEMWIEDIAYCSVMIEYDRALIAAFQRKCLTRIHSELTAPLVDFNGAALVPAPVDPAAADWLDLYAAAHFVAPKGMTHLADRHFAILLGHLTSQELHQLQRLQAMLHAEMIERDRIINQLHRTRRQAMRDAVEQAEMAARSVEKAPALAGPADPASTSGPDNASDSQSGHADLRDPVSAADAREVEAAGGSSFAETGERATTALDDGQLVGEVAQHDAPEAAELVKEVA